MQNDFSGVDAVNVNGSRVKINFNTPNSIFMSIVSEYTRRYNEFVESLENHEQPKLR